MNYGSSLGIHIDCWWLTALSTADRDFKLRTKSDQSMRTNRWLELVPLSITNIHNHSIQRWHPHLLYGLFFLFFFPPTSLDCSNKQVGGFILHIVINRQELHELFAPDRFHNSKEKCLVQSAAFGPKAQNGPRWEQLQRKNKQRKSQWVTGRLQREKKKK